MITNCLCLALQNIHPGCSRTEKHPRVRRGRLQVRDKLQAIGGDRSGEIGNQSIIALKFMYHLNLAFPYKHSGCGRAEIYLCEWRPRK